MWIIIARSYLFRRYGLPVSRKVIRYAVAGEEVQKGVTGRLVRLNEKGGGWPGTCLAEKKSKCRYCQLVDQPSSLKCRLKLDWRHRLKPGQEMRSNKETKGFLNYWEMIDNWGPRRREELGETPAWLRYIYNRGLWIPVAQIKPR